MMSVKDILEKIKPVEKYKPYVFISYSSKDSLIVFQDVLKLQQEGFNIWLDEKNLDKTKPSWKKDALPAISSRMCRFLLFYVSGNSLTSANCCREVQFTSSDEVLNTHPRPVPFACIDVVETGDIIAYCNHLADELYEIEIPENIDEAEKEDFEHRIDERISSVNTFRDKVFNGNNERVRIHPKEELDRKTDYYEDILNTLPGETILSESDIKTVSIERTGISTGAAVHSDDPGLTAEDLQEHFRKTTAMTEYKSFVKHVLEKYYGTDFFTQVNGQDFPVWAIKGLPVHARKSILDFDSLSDIENSELDDFDANQHHEYIQYPWYREYHKILKGTIKYPDRPGYMLKDMELNDNGEITGFSARVGTYAENVYGTHVLEYEMYRLYQEYKEADIDNPAVWKEMKEKMVVRNSFHLNVPDPDDPEFKHRMSDSLLHMNKNTHSLLSVQMLVAVKSAFTGKHELKIVQRSTHVAIAPDVYQMIPAGGFEILNDSSDGMYDAIELESNFSAGCAVFREYLEELFNMPEFKGNGRGSIEEQLLKDEHIELINKMIAEKKAHLQFLGSAIDLAGLRHELSFALVIDDEDYSKQKFIPNEECKKGRILERISLDQFEKRTSIWKHIHGPSAVMWYLFKKTKMYQEALEQDENM